MDLQGISSFFDDVCLAQRTAAGYDLLRLGVVGGEKNMETDQTSRFRGSVFFYVFPPGPPEKAAYQHSIICLAEGLRELGIPFFSNINYWRTSPEEEGYLFKHDPEVTCDDCTVVVMDQFWFCYGAAIPQNLFHPGRKYITVYMDWSDEQVTRSWNQEFRKFDFIFRTHWNRRCSYPSNFHPWAFGLSDRIIGETADLPNFQARRRVLLNNSRIEHSLRRIIRNKFLTRIQEVLPLDNTVESLDEHPSGPYHLLQWKQTGRRHYPGYYKRLRESVASACFSGFFLPPELPKLLARKFLKNLWFKIAEKADLTSDRVAQWDSWRFWESLSAGCVAFHLDFERYGLYLPVMPQNWKHYIGIDLNNVQKVIDRMLEEPEVLEKISTQGRRWALENYSPVPVALQFLEKVLG